jgi:hypothetical protein
MKICYSIYISVKGKATLGSDLSVTLMDIRMVAVH